jgi:phosphopantetheinyl transferase (holo-ACP synthase)
VDLISPENRQKSTDSRYLKRILTDTEIEQVRCSDNPDATLWSFWACKEAAYKVILKQSSGAAFLPRHWTVHFRHPSSAVEHQGSMPSEVPPDDQTPTVYAAGDVEISGKKSIPFFLSSCLSYVHCLAADYFDILDKVIWRVEVLSAGRDQKDRDPSIFARSCLAHALSAFLRDDQSQIKILRGRGKGGELQPPAVYLNGIKADIDVSLSHDGQFVAYAFLA